MSDKHYHKHNSEDMPDMIWFILRTIILIALAGILLFFYPNLTSHAQTWKATADVNVRDRANMDSNVISCLKKGTKVKQTGIDGHWIAIQSEGQTGYIYYKFLKKVADTRLWVNADAVNLREKATTESEKLGLLYKGDQVLMISAGNGWYRIKTKKGKTGYVCGEYMSKKLVKPDPADSSGNKKSGKKAVPSFKSDANTGRRLKEASGHANKISKYRAAAMDTAKSYLGVKYSQKKRNKKGYADCSSLVRDIFKSVTGTGIGDTTVDQTDTMNEFIYPIDSVYDVAPGDLVYHMSSDNHTGIYLGDGMVLHASQGKGKVVISSFPKNGSFWEYGCNAALFCAVH